MPIGENINFEKEKLMKKTGRTEIFPKKPTRRKRVAAKRDTEFAGIDETYGNGRLERLFEALEAVRMGDISVRLTKEEDDIYGAIADSYNGMVDLFGGVVGELSRVSREVGTEGILGGQAEVPGVAGVM